MVPRRQLSRGPAPGPGPASGLPGPGRRPLLPGLCPHLGRADHALGHVQVALVVLADLGNDEARVLPAHPAPGAQLQFQRHRGGSRSSAALQAASRSAAQAEPAGLRSHVSSATLARPRAANPRAPPCSHQPIETGGGATQEGGAVGRENPAGSVLKIWALDSQRRSQGPNCWLQPPCMHPLANIPEEGLGAGGRLSWAWGEGALRCNGKIGFWSWT